MNDKLAAAELPLALLGVIGIGMGFLNLNAPEDDAPAPRWQAFTVTDFGDFCRRTGLKVTDQLYLSGNRRLQTHWCKNLRSKTAVFELTRL